MSRHIKVVSVRAGNKCSGTMYALSQSGIVYRAKAYVPTDEVDDICKALEARGTIQLKQWIRVKKLPTTKLYKSIHRPHDYSIVAHGASKSQTLVEVTAKGVSA